MPFFNPILHPVLSTEDAKTFEAAYFKDEPAAEWVAMREAGEAVAEGIVLDWQERGAFPAAPRILVLAGKGHNGGDALIAANALLSRFPRAAVEVLFPVGDRALRPLTQRAHWELVQHAPGRVRTVRLAEAVVQRHDIAIDGVFGFQFRGPLSAELAADFEAVNQAEITLRAAVDLPSGLGEAGALKADFTYATGSVKKPLLDRELRAWVGRPRYLDLGFFAEETVPARALTGPALLAPATLAPLVGWRDPLSDKRDYGHLFVVGGSRSFPGAIMMTVRAALRSGVGLLTAFVPEALVPAYAAHVPEAMWVGCPETPQGGLALEGMHLLRERRSRASALVIGPGLAREPETLAFARDIVAGMALPAVIDADALQTEIVAAGEAVKIVTPHAGEFARIAGGSDLRTFASERGVVAVLKGSPTYISDGNRECCSLAGGPVLARGGSGDILAGMIGGLLAQHPTEAFGAACCGVSWHGQAADALARAHGATSVQTTQLLDFLPRVLRGEVNV